VRRRGEASIRVRLTAAAVAAVLLAALIGAFLFLQMLRSSMEAGLLTTDRQDIADISAQLADGATPGEIGTRREDDVVVQLVGARGRVLAGATGGPLMREPAVRHNIEVRGRDDHYTVVASRPPHGGRVHLVVAGRSTEQVDRATTTALWLLTGAIPAALALVGLTIWLSVGRALRPVEAVRREADEITSAHLDRRVPTPPGQDEIARLASTINAMLDRIGESHRRQRQFVSDASHELRSPLASIRQTVEVARGYPDKMTMSELTDAVLEESVRLESLVNALLLLARLDDDKRTVTSELVDLDDVVLLEASRVTPRPHVTIDVSHVSAGQVHGRAVFLRQVVRNLLDNALRHARRRVTVSVQEDGTDVLLTVDDDGDGIPVPERDRVFERFVRLDDARAREEGGAGLGLAIVRSFVESSDGTVVVDEAPCGGARFVVRLPAAT
jgi:signal transduction histidine kinase